MAFINERITDEDIEKYNLMDLWDTYKADETISVLNESKPYSFAIDRQSENWLIYLAKVKHESWEPKHQSYTKENIFIFYYTNKIYEVRFIKERDEGKYIDKVKRIFRHEITWSLKSMIPAPREVQTFKVLLKGALKVYGERGLSSEEDENIIECLF